jgi:hypothetical protein
MKRLSVMHVRFIVLFLVVTTMSLQGGQRATVPTAGENRPFNPRDIVGIWSRNPQGTGGGGTCRECGDRGFGNDVPPLTPEGQKKFDANKPSYGRALDSTDAAAHPEEHIGRRRAVPPSNGTDPYQYCNPQGVPRAILFPDAIEFLVLPDRVVNTFTWEHRFRTIWTDGRQLPKPEDIDEPRWLGYTVGRWDGDTFVIESVGHDDRTWVDHFGYPHSDMMRLEERWRRISYDTLQLDMTIIDSKIYTRPWKSQTKQFKFYPKESFVATSDGKWFGLREDVCAPADEVEHFIKDIRDPAGGKPR